MDLDLKIQIPSLVSYITAEIIAVKVLNHD